MEVLQWLTHPAFWLIFGLVLIILEITTLTFILLWVGIAAIITGISALMFPSLSIQLIIFSVATLLLLIYTRPLTRRWRKRTPNIQSGVYALIGKEGIIVEEVTEHKNGSVKIGGEIWSAASDTRLDVGQKVVVTGVEGVTLKVKEID